jgi:hypothetical protein
MKEMDTLDWGWELQETGIWDCCEDPNVCWRSCCCFICVAAEIARLAEDTKCKGHELRSATYSFFVTVCWPCSFCCCMRDMLPWKVTQWSDILYRKRWEYTKHPEPFGEMQICGSYMNVNQPFFFWPYVMQLTREIKLRIPDYNRMVLGPPIPMPISNDMKLKHMTKVNRLQNLGKTTFFISHSWGLDDENRDNHKRVVTLGRMLQSRGYKLFLDEDDMEGDIKSTMSKGIANTSIFIVCVTKSYMKKVNDEKSNNCQYEYKCARNMNKLFFSSCYGISYEGSFNLGWYTSR